MPLSSAQELVALPGRIHEWVCGLPQGARGTEALSEWRGRIEHEMMMHPLAVARGSGPADRLVAKDRWSFAETGPPPRPGASARSEGAGGKENRVGTWRQLNPTLARAIDISQGFMWIFAAIVFTGAAFGILNTLLMEIFERRREFGLLLGLGWAPWRLVGVVICEGMWIALAGGLIGVGLGGALSAYLERVGWDISGFSGHINFSGIVMSTVLRTVSEPSDYWGTMLFVCGTTLLCAVYPMVKVARLDPVEAMR